MSTVTFPAERFAYAVGALPVTAAFARVSLRCTILAERPVTTLQGLKTRWTSLGIFTVHAFQWPTIHTHSMALWAFGGQIVSTSPTAFEAVKVGIFTSAFCIFFGLPNVLRSFGFRHWIDFCYVCYCWVVGFLHPQSYDAQSKKARSTVPWHTSNLATSSAMLGHCVGGLRHGAAATSTTAFSFASLLLQCPVQGGQINSA
eukprot:gene4211-14324_t